VGLPNDIFGTIESSSDLWMTASLEEQIGEYREGFVGKGLDRVNGTAIAGTEFARVSKLRCKSSLS